MNGMQMMGQRPPLKESTWEEHIEELKINIANAEKSLLMAKAQLKEAELHIKEE